MLAAGVVSWLDLHAEGVEVSDLHAEGVEVSDLHTEGVEDALRVCPRGRHFLFAAAAPPPLALMLVRVFDPF